MQDVEDMYKHKLYYHSITAQALINAETGCSLLTSNINLKCQIQLSQKCTSHLSELIMQMWARCCASPWQEGWVHLHLAPLVPSRVPLRRDTAVSIAESTIESSIWLNLPQVLPQFDSCKSATRLLKDGAFQLFESLAEVSWLFCLVWFLSN